MSVTNGPVQVFLSYAPEDAEFAFELETHLSFLARQGEISLWTDRQIAAGENLMKVRAEKLRTARMIVVLVSASFLASDFMYEGLVDALRRRKAGEVQVVPILVRPCDWRSSPLLQELQPLPRNQIPVASWADGDEALAEIARELRSMLKFGPERVQPSRGATPHQVRPIEDIFRTVGQPDITFVEPAQFKALRRCLRTLGKGLVVEGPSGVGKTTLVSRALRDVEAMQQEWLFGQVEEHRRKLEERLSKGFLGHLIVDDFHRLDHALKARVADAMKIIADRDARDAKLTVIGINPVGDSLVSALRDLAGRFDVIAMGRQPDEKISELIRKGEEAANISFRRREEFILAAGGSFFIAQQLCQEAA